MSNMSILPILLLICESNNSNTCKKNSNDNQIQSIFDSSTCKNALEKNDSTNAVSSQINLKEIFALILSLFLRQTQDYSKQDAQETKAVNNDDIQKNENVSVADNTAQEETKAANEKPVYSPIKDNKGKSIDNQYLLAYINETMGTTDVTAEDAEKKMYSKTVNADGSTSTKYNQKYSLSAQILKNGGDKEKQADLLLSIIRQKAMNETRLELSGKSALESLVFGLGESYEYSKGVEYEHVNSVDLSADEKIAIYTNFLDNYEQLVSIIKPLPLTGESLDSVLNKQNEAFNSRISALEIVCKGNSELLEHEKSEINIGRKLQAEATKGSWKSSSSGPVFGA